MPKLAASILIALLTFATYASSLNNPFLMDDHALVLDNPYLGDASHLQLNPFTSPKDKAGGEEYIYFRPITHLADYISYLLYGRNVFGYHSLNLALLFIAALLWWHLAARITDSKWMAFLASAFFVTHPVFGVLVNYTSTTGYVILIILSILGMLWHLDYLTTQRRRKLVGASLFFLMSLLCHETAAGFPFYLLGILYFVKNMSLRKAFAQTLPYLGIIAGYLVFRMNYASLKSGVIDNIGGFELSMEHYGAMFAQLAFNYIGNLVMLKDIVLIYSAPGTASPWLWIIALAVALAVIGWLLFKHWRQDIKGLFLWWLVVGFGPVTLACFSRPSMGLIISPHWLLVPSLGYCLFLSVLFVQLWKKGHQKITIAIIGFMLIGYVSVSQYYNRLWGNEVLYCHYMLKLSPRIPLAKFWLAHAYASNKQWELARGYFKETIMGVENDWKGYVNLGVIEANLGNPEGELFYYYKALQRKPNSPEIWNNVATIYINQGNFTKAREILSRLVNEHPEMQEAHENLRKITNSP